MDSNLVVREINELPPQAQREVANFISFLRERYAPARKTRRNTRRGNLAQEPFVGMWRDCQEMTDSTGWIREVRRREWPRHRNGA